ENTGSGKGTQLVQFLADSGLAGVGSIICTQPRKIGAVSLAQRVGEESSGCYKDDAVICYPSFSSAQGFKSKVIFMTDHCLLQHYMNDKTLGWNIKLSVDIKYIPSASGESMPLEDRSWIEVEWASKLQAPYTDLHCLCTENSHQKNKKRFSRTTKSASGGGGNYGGGSGGGGGKAVVVVVVGGG
ncbi:hypothetical protein IFM89_034807, partial [Coptis chinensis]